MLEGEVIAMRTGSEPATARSPLRLRLWLSLWGTFWALFGLLAFSLTGRPGWAVACAVLLALTLLDLWVVTYRMRQGARYQPGRDVPPYEPDQDGRPRWRGPDPGDGTRPP
ncbi:DUF6343 family protein [Streptomyces rhizosphaericola]|uniref:DUF2530 domain-containing protein n=1 Tax=Streptomyces rhizosphaericola TaxID=2564098 RepID=A0ABY2PBS6_9ACTN|nr:MULTISPECIES: DUF6343 family protein [Streptomyces]ARI55104.1 hypothetical protein A6E92_25240 [Streptomyces sp. S8]NGO85318.1 hypothetical protein [Streptomyces sp. 196(2019)]TGZ07443.1 hypothetical protein E5Z02_20775 [Streptomyces rhizosphaericola]